MARPNKVNWATNIVVDPTTGQDNRRTTGLTSGERSSGYVPAAVKPSRQSMNTVLYELGLWTEYLEDEWLPISDAIRDMFYHNRNGVFLQPGALYSNSNLLTFDASKIGAVLEDPTSSSNDIPYYNVAGPIFDKDNNATWASGSGNGLKAYSGTVTDQHIYLFMVGKQTGFGFSAIDYATDTDPLGANVKTNANGPFITESYTHLKLIAVLPFINNVSDKFAEFVYGQDDMILYGDEQTASTNTAATTSGSFVTNTMHLQAPASAKAAPNEATNMLVDLRGNPSVASLILRADSLSTRTGRITLTNNALDHVVHLLYTKNSTIQIASASGGSNAAFDYKVLGYKNPAVG